MTGIRFDAVNKSLGARPILRDISLDIPDGELWVLVGPSGCGKSTLLRVLAGLERPDSGSVFLGQRNVTAAPPKERDVAMVFQSYALYPHMTVAQNIAFGLKVRGESPERVQTRIHEVSQMLGLHDLLERLPRQLSGGQRQRVAMGRAIARRPNVFLFDEPLSNLDAGLRTDVRLEIKRLHSALATTMLYVTHDQVEAMTLADRLVVMNAGRIEQVGPPLEVYARPRTLFVAKFVGSPSMNLIPPSPEGHPWLRSKQSPPEGALVCGIRPHDVSAANIDGPQGTRAGLQVEVRAIEPLGAELFIHGRLMGHPTSAPFVARLPAEWQTKVAPGAVLDLEVALEHVHWFDSKTGARHDPTSRR